MRPRELSAWIDYVADKGDWRECRYVSDGGPFAGLARMLSASLQSSS